MMACMGYIAPEYFRWPGYCSPSTGTCELVAVFVLGVLFPYAFLSFSSLCWASALRLCSAEI